MAARHKNPQPPITTPDAIGGGRPPYAPAAYDHSFVLQAVMELHRSTGQLTESISSLHCSIEKQDAKLNRIEEKLSGVTHKIYAAGVVLAILVAVGAFIIDKAWDLMAEQIRERPASIAPVQPGKS